MKIKKKFGQKHWKTQMITIWVTETHKLYCLNLKHSYQSKLKMFNNSTSSDSYSTDNPILVIQILCVSPEYINLFFLSCSIYGMYQGIEIVHPLYSVLFLNLIVSLLTTILDITEFFFISTAKYIVLSNLTNSLSLFFHCTSWSVTSILRFVFIVYGDWFNNLILSQKLQCASALLITCALSIILSIPTFSVAIFYGKYFFFIWSLKKIFINCFSLKVFI